MGWSGGSARRSGRSERRGRTTTVPVVGAEETLWSRVVDVLLAVLAGCVAGLVAGYAVMWLGGAVELLTQDEIPDGPTCYQFLAVGRSDAAVGEEADRWLGGSWPGRPGRVCVVEPSDAAMFSAEELGPTRSAEFAAGPVGFPVLSETDAASALMSVVVFAAVAVFVSVRVHRRRRRRVDGARGTSDDVAITRTSAPGPT